MKLQFGGDSSRWLIPALLLIALALLWFFIQYEKGENQSRPYGMRVESVRLSGGSVEVTFGHSEEFKGLPVNLTVIVQGRMRGQYDWREQARPISVTLNDVRGPGNVASFRLDDAMDEELLIEASIWDGKKLLSKKTYVRYVMPRRR
jgi:hypothetical protein